jgi:acyl carrier protein
MEIERQVKTFVTKNILFSGKLYLTADQSFLESGIIDSTGVLELVEFLERRFHIEITDEEMIPENLDSIERISMFIAAKISQTVEE